SATLTAARSIFSAGRTIVLPVQNFVSTVRTHDRGFVASLFATSNIAATALIWIWRFIHLCDFSRIFSVDNLTANSRRALNRTDIALAYSSIAQLIPRRARSLVRRIDRWTSPA